MTGPDQRDRSVADHDSAGILNYYVPGCLSVRPVNGTLRALDSLTKRESGRLVEEQLMDCHSPDRARKLAAGPVVLAEELRQPDRRELDDAVFEMLGVSDSRERSELIDRLYEVASQHFRDIRVVEIEKMEQRARSENVRLNIHDLAADIWDAIEFEDLLPVGQWVTESPESTCGLTCPKSARLFCLIARCSLTIRSTSADHARSRCSVGRGARPN